MGYQLCSKSNLVIKPVLVLSKHAGAKELILEMLEQLMALCPRKGSSKERMELLGWSLRWEEEILSHLNECSITN
ncbi:hypothetical protein CFP56_010223 [Quercus suber]|uniref:Uncharacterized protein n=1 Tax=Quercus suber TaxID=58331 RepID=A0AAW0L249_QUESU